MMTPAHYEALKERLPAWLTPPTIVLGLDLQGGSHVMLEVDKADILTTQVKNLREDVRRILREGKVAITGGIGATPEAFNSALQTLRIGSASFPNCVSFAMDSAHAQAAATRPLMSKKRQTA